MQFTLDASKQRYKTEQIITTTKGRKPSVTPYHASVEQISYAQLYILKEVATIHVTRITCADVFLLSIKNLRESPAIMHSLVKLLYTTQNATSTHVHTKHIHAWLDQPFVLTRFITFHRNKLFLRNKKSGTRIPNSQLCTPSRSLCSLTGYTLITLC